MKDRYQILFLFYEDIKKVSRSPSDELLLTQMQKDPKLLQGWTSGRYILKYRCVFLIPSIPSFIPMQCDPHHRTQSMKFRR